MTKQNIAIATLAVLLVSTTLSDRSRMDEQDQVIRLLATAGRLNAAGSICHLRDHHGIDVGVIFDTTYTNPNNDDTVRVLDGTT